MNKDYYVEYYTLEREHWWFVVRAGIIKDRIAPYLNNQKSCKILNIGAATGSTSELLSQFGEVTSIEYDADCCAFTRERTNLQVQHGSILDLDFPDNNFDLVCAFDVIEHVEDDQLAVEEMQRVCKPGGLVYITVPAYNFLWSEHDEVNHHFRRYTLGGLKKLFDRKRVKFLYHSYFNSLLFIPIATFRLLSKMIPSSWYRKGAGADNTILDNDSIVNKILFQIFNMERKLLKVMKFPFGVSIMLLLRKNDSEHQ